MKNYEEMSYIERLEEGIRIILKDIDYNNRHGIDNSFNYEIYEELTTEYDIYLNIEE